jgi:hypothetical protein
VIVLDVSSSEVKAVSGLAKDVSAYVPCTVILSDSNSVVELQDRGGVAGQV